MNRIWHDFPQLENPIVDFVSSATLYFIMAHSTAVIPLKKGKGISNLVSESDSWKARRKLTGSP